MGLFAFIILCFIVVALAWLGVWVIGHFAPGHPAIIDRIIWGVAVLIILYNLFTAMGLMSHDPQIPSFR
jgi:hypothetical protein